MATPAETPIQRRYSAGYCALDVTLQPLALSKWYPQPVVQDLQFRLWMRGDASAEPMLLAEGDRSTLQSISHYVSQQIQTSLVTARLGASANATDGLSGSQANVLPKPSALQTSQPLSYLQLSDLASVLNQCEQSVCVLPVALSIVKASTAASSAASSDQNNVVPFSPARRTEPTQRSGATRRSPLRRRRTQVWAASSAAALLLAVGLTNALRPDSQREQQMTASSSDRSDINAETESIAPSVAPDSAISDALSDDKADTKVAPSPSGVGSADGAQQIPSAPSSRIESPLPPEDVPAITSPDSRLRERRADSSQIAANPSPSRAAPTAPTPSEREDNEGAIASGAAPSDTRQLPNSPPVVETAPDIAAALPSEPTSETSGENGASSVDAAEAPAAFTFDDFDVADESSAVPESSTATRTSRSSSGQAESEPIAPAPAVTESVQQRAGLEREAVRLQVRSYFQARWQQLRDESVSAPLGYELQLSKTGDVVGFTGLDEMAQAYRDRLFSEESPPQFSPTADGLQLRIDILPDGQVLVSDR